MRLRSGPYPRTTFYGFRESGGNGSLDDVTFTTAGSDDHEINALTTSNDTVAFQLESALAAADKKNLVLHICDAAEYGFDSAVVGGTSSYLYTSAGQDWSGHAERTLYLSQDAAAPTLGSATVNNTTLKLNFNEPLGAATSLDKGAFAVKKNDPAQTLTLTGSPSISGNTVTLDPGHGVIGHVGRQQCEGDPTPSLALAPRTRSSATRRPRLKIRTWAT